MFYSKKKGTFSSSSLTAERSKRTLYKQVVKAVVLHYCSPAMMASNRSFTGAQHAPNIAPLPHTQVAISSTCVFTNLRRKPASTAQRVAPGVPIVCIASNNARCCCAVKVPSKHGCCISAAAAATPATSAPVAATFFCNRSLFAFSPRRRIVRGCGSWGVFSK